MIEEIVEIVEQLLQGQSYESFDKLSSDSNNVNSCCQIIESDEYLESIRFNVCKILFNLIYNFASTSWPLDYFERLNSWFINLIDKDDLPDTEKNDLSSHPLLAKQIGKSYACLLFSYRRQDKANFRNFIEAIQTISENSKSRLIATLNFLTGFCQYYGDLKSDNFDIYSDIPTIEITQLLLNALSQISEEPQPEIQIIQSSFELMNTVLYYYQYKVNACENETDISINGLPNEISTVFCESSIFIQSYLLGYFKKINDTNLRLLILDLLFHISYISISQFKRVENAILHHKYVFQDLIDLIDNFLFESASFGPEEWKYIEYICMISLKMQKNLRSNFVEKINSYPQFLSSFSNLCLNLIFVFDSEEIETDSVNNFFDNSQIFSNCLCFWAQVYELFSNMKFELKTIVFQSTTEIVKKCVDFLFFAVHQNPESSFISFQENPQNYCFTFLNSLINITSFNIQFFNDFFNDILTEKFEAYMNDMYSIDTELDISLILCLCSEFLVKYCAFDSNYANYDFMNFLDTDPETRESPKLNFVEMEIPIISQIVNLINETNNEDLIRDYIDFHQSASIPFFLENSILSFAFNFKKMVFYGDNLEIQRILHNHQIYKKDDMLSIIINRICLDTTLFSMTSFDFYTDILIRVVSILSYYSDISNKYSCISNHEYFEQLLNAGNSINDITIKKRFNDSLFKFFMDNKFLFMPIKNEDGEFPSIFESISNQLGEEFISDFDKKIDDQILIQNFNKLLIDYSCLFNSVSEENGFNFLFDSIFLKYYQFFDDNSVLIFSNKDISSYALKFWLSMVKGRSKIKFPQYSINGLLLVKTTLNVLSSFFNNFNKYANDENLGNYLECLNLSLSVYNHTITSTYFSFKIFEIYNDTCFIESVDFILKSLMKFDMKNLFYFTKIANQMINLSVNLLNKHINVVLNLEDDLIFFLFRILEASLFAPSLIGLPSKSIYDTIVTFINFCDKNRENEKIESLLSLLDNRFNRFFLEMWQVVFSKDFICDSERKVICCLLSFYHEFPQQPREAIITALPEDYRPEFDELLENIAQDLAKIKTNIEEINKKAHFYFPFKVSIIDCFPINWNLDDN